MVSDCFAAGIRAGFRSHHRDLAVFKLIQNGGFFERKIIRMDCYCSSWFQPWMSESLSHFSAYHPCNLWYVPTRRKKIQHHWSVWPAGMILVDLLHGEIVDNKPKQNWDGSYFITHRTVVSYSNGPRSWKSLRCSKLMFFWLPAKSGLGSVSPKCYPMFDPIVTRKSPMVPPGSTYFHQLLALFCSKNIIRSPPL
jgi:hypothetical protein